MCKTLALSKWLLLLITSFILPLTAYAKNADWTDIEECEAIVNTFSGNAFTPLFNGEHIVVLVGTARQGGGPGTVPSPGCSIDFTLKDKADERALGGITLYRQQNAYQIFKDRKADYATLRNYSAPASAVFHWAAEAYYTYSKVQKFQEFGVYTKTGDFVVFKYNNNSVVRATLLKGDIQLLEKNFIQFISIVSQQMKY